MASIGKATIDIQADATGFGKSASDEVTKALDGVAAEAAKVFDNIELDGKGAFDGMSLSADAAAADVIAAMDKISRGAEGAGDKSNAEMKRSMDAMAADVERAAADAAASLDRIGMAGGAAGDKANTGMRAGLGKIGSAADGAYREITSAFDKAASGVAGAADKINTSMERAFDEVGDDAKAKAADIGKVFGAITVGAVGGSLFAGFNVEGEIARVNAQLGYVGATAEHVGGSITEVMRGGVASSSEEAARAVGALESNFKYLGSEGEQSAAALSDNFLAFARTFDIDIAEAVQTAGQLIGNGLAPDIETAADLMTTAMQRVPEAMRGELPEIMNEYGTNFRALGFSGEEAFGLLVNAAGQGKFALDKTGDSLKEFTIRGSDMSKASTAAYESIGLDATEMSRAVAEGGEGAQAALQQVVDGLLGIEDPAARSNAAIALFGTPLEDLSVDQIPQFLEGLQGAGDSMAEFGGASQLAADEIANSLSGRLDALKGVLLGLATQGFMAAWDAAQKFGGWVRDNQSWLGPTAIGIGAIAAAITVFFIPAMIGAGISSTVEGAKIVLAWIKIAASSWTSMGTHVANAARVVASWVLMGTQATIQAARMAVAWFIALGPIGWVIGALVGIGAAFVVLWNTSDGFRNFWIGLWESIKGAAGVAWGWLKAGWDALAAGFMWAYENLIKPVFNAFVTVAQVAFTIIATMILAPLLLAWQALSWGMRAAYDGIIKPMWDALTDAALWLWETVLSPVFTWIGDKWNDLSNRLQLGWMLMQGIFWAFKAEVTNFWNAYISPIFTWIGNKWNDLHARLQLGWMMIQGIFWAFKAEVTNFWNAYISPIFTWIGDKWDWVRGKLGEGWAWINDHVFKPMGTALDTLKGWFRTAADAIGETWNTLKDKTGAPIKWVVDKVYNNGIRTVWEHVSDFVGLDKKLPEVKLGFASGGVLPGYTPGRDVHNFVDPKSGMAIGLSGGEAIMRPEWTRAVGGASAVHAMNKAAISGNLDKSGHGHSHAHADGGIIQNFALGGIVQAGARLTTGVQRSMWDAVRGRFPTAQLSSGTRNGGGGSFHDQGLAIDLGGGWASDLQGIANWIASGYPHAAELFWDPGPNIDEGRPTGAIGGHSDHVHWAMRDIVDPYTGEVVSGGGGGGGGFMNWARTKVAEAVSKFLDPIGNSIPEFPGMVGEVPKAAFNWIKDKFVGAIMPAADESGYNGPVGAGVEQWRGLVEQVLGAKNHSLSLTNTVLRRMNQESTGDPRAINNWDSNAKAGWPTKGLMQMRDDTFLSNADPGFNRNIWDPESNLRSSMNYAMRRYGSLPAAYDKAGGYHLGGLMGAGQGMFHKTAIDPEMVLSPEQTQAFVDWMQAGSGKGTNRVQVMDVSAGAAFASEVINLLGVQPGARGVDLPDDRGGRGGNRTVNVTQHIYDNDPKRAAGDVLDFLDRW